MGSRRIAVESWLQLRRANHSGGTRDPQRGTACSSVEALFLCCSFTFFKHVLCTFWSFLYIKQWGGNKLLGLLPNLNLFFFFQLHQTDSYRYHFLFFPLFFVNRTKITKTHSCTCPGCVTRDIIVMKRPALLLTVTERRRCRSEHVGQCGRPEWNM